MCDRPVGKDTRMSGAREAAKAGFGLSMSALRHAGWWLEWQMRATPRRGCRGPGEHDLLEASDDEPLAQPMPDGSLGESACAS